jgi:hypothetical protein
MVKRAFKSPSQNDESVKLVVEPRLNDNHRNEPWATPPISHLGHTRPKKKKKKDETAIVLGRKKVSGGDGESTKR